MYNIYKHLPVFLQNILCSGYGYKEKRVRFGKRFDYWRNKLEEMDTYSKSEIEAYQNEKLREVVRAAYNNVPYYYNLFNANNLHPTDINSTADLYKIPVTSKEDIRKHKEDLINRNFKKNDLIEMSTSGTTGKSLSFYSTEEAISFQWAVWFRHRSRFGFNFGDKHLNFTVRPVVPLNQNTPPYWRWNRAFNQALVNMQMIQKDKIRHIVDFINKNKFKYWTGHPSTIHSFCSFILEGDHNLIHQPEVIFLGAENTYSNQKRDIKMVTGAKLTDQYGFTEGCGNASHCKELNHHEDFEFGILESKGNTKTPKQNREGSIIATGFANLAFPFIRYEVGDYGIWAPSDYECSCGRNSDVLKEIEGRIEDYIITPEGRRVKRFAFLFKETPEVREAQIVQYEYGEIIINIVKRSNYTSETERKIKKKVKNWVSPDLEVKFKYLTEIPREQNGKFRAIKSKLNGR